MLCVHACTHASTCSFRGASVWVVIGTFVELYHISPKHICWEQLNIKARSSSANRVHFLIKLNLEEHTIYTHLVSFLTEMITLIYPVLWQSFMVHRLTSLFSFWLQPEHTCLLFLCSLFYWGLLIEYCKRFDQRVARQQLCKHSPTRNNRGRCVFCRSDQCTSRLAGWRSSDMCLL
jgi:hypothetical protein